MEDVLAARRRVSELRVFWVMVTIMTPTMSMAVFILVTAMLDKIVVMMVPTMGMLVMVRMFTMLLLNIIVMGMAMTRCLFCCWWCVPPLIVTIGCNNDDHDNECDSEESGF